jgi:hypothetical protein
MRFTILLYCFALATSALSRAQSKTLHQEQSQVMNASLGTNDWGLADAACDAKGNVFVTAWNPEGEGPADRPLLMFDSAGILKMHFASSRKDLGLSAAAPSYQPPYQPTALVSDGGVVRLVWSYDGMSLDVFSADGKLISITPLDPPAIIPYQLAVFPSGELLVSGLEHVHSRRALAAYKSFTAVYSKEGHLQKRLALPEDTEIDAAAEIGDSRYAQGPMFGNRAVEGGAARLGDDGNVYLMRRTSPATVYVISAAGELLRTLRIGPEDTGQMPIDMQVAAGRIAVEFSLSCSAGQCQGTNFTVSDATTGQKLSEYSDSSVPGVLACYSAKPERFTFLTVSDNHKLEMVEATAK